MPNTQTRASGRVTAVKFGPSKTRSEYIKGNGTLTAATDGKTAKQVLQNVGLIDTNESLDIIKISTTLFRISEHDKLTKPLAEIIRALAFAVISSADLDDIAQTVADVVSKRVTETLDTRTKRDEERQENMDKAVEKLAETNKQQRKPC